jgi:Heparinase II/III-like protein
VRRILEPELAHRRRVVAATPVLGRLAARLEALLGGLTEGPVYIPADKALLSRDGGVCPTDGSRLLFDPDAPFEHRCARCGAVVSGHRHHRAWVTRYQLWLSERTVHLALLGAVRDRPHLSARAAEILVLLADRYHDYPNEDNVLGPTRPFFSTYLESIWLAQLGVTLSLLDASAPEAVGTADRRRVCDMLRESASLVGSFDEGWSNRQVWHAAALASAGGALGDRGLRTAGIDRLASMLRAVDDDGFWFEGENYHLFALRGFLLGAEIARWHRHDLYRGGRLGAMYGAPIATLLPDLTLPARGDAPYGVSVSQPRFADLWEMGRARTPDPRVEAMLGVLYRAELPDGEDLGRAELSEQEQNQPATRLRRDRLSWKCLLWMRPEDPADVDLEWASAALLERQGLAVLRPGAERMVSLECGRPGGGHAHPDRLHLSLYWDGPALADFGTASYVSPSLHWYRSTLAHNAPGVAGVGQGAAQGACDGIGAQGPWTWCSARVPDLVGAGSEVVRWVLAGPEWILDVVAVRASGDVTIDLPVHPLAGVSPADAKPAVLRTRGDAGHETGYDVLREVRSLSPERVRSVALSGDLRLHLVARNDEQVFSAVAPGPPTADFADGIPLRFLVRRAAGAGRWIQLIAPSAAAPVIEETGDTIVIQTASGRTAVRDHAGGVEIRPDAGEPTSFARRQISRSQHEAPLQPVTPVAVPLCAEGDQPFAPNAPVATWRLGAQHYRRSERSHSERGGTTAVVDVAGQGDALWVRVRVAKPEVVVRDSAAPDPALDNEAADIHSDGVQVYVGREHWAGVVALPDLEGGTVRVRAVAGSALDAGAVTGSSARAPDGYTMTLRIPVGTPLRRGERLRFTVTVNEMVRGRTRRAGQLALGGGGWVWLRGDRESPATAVAVEIA